MITILKHCLTPFSIRMESILLSEVELNTERLDTRIAKYALLSQPVSVLIYSTARTLLNNPGGLKGCKIKPKEVVQYANTTNQARCPVSLFKLYNSLCPQDDRHQVFYLQPLKILTNDRWYSSKPLGHNSLSNMVKKMCAAAGIEGHRTNHSLRTTAATRLFRAGIDEQLIMERTGHRSVDGVRNYKRTSEE